MAAKPLTTEDFLLRAARLRTVKEGECHPALFRLRHVVAAKLCRYAACPDEERHQQALRTVLFLLGEPITTDPQIEASHSSTVGIRRVTDRDRSTHLK